MPVAVILPAAGHAGALATAEALRRQSTPLAGCADSLAGALTLAAELADPWIWLLDSGVVPEPRALQSLLDALASLDQRPVLLASKILTPDGELDPRATPVPDTHRPDRVLAALDQRCLALRVARSGSLLIHAQALEGLDIGDSGAFVDRDLEWTAKAMQRGTGVLVPASIATRQWRGEQRGLPMVSRRIASSIRMLAALEPSDNRLWFAVHLVEHWLSSLRRRQDR